MAKNAKLSGQEIPEDEERLLEDGVFPNIYGKVDGNTQPVIEAFELDKDLEAIAAGDTKLVSNRIALCQELVSWSQAIGTPTGFFLLQSLAAQSKLLQSCCLRLATHHPEFVLEVPLYPWLRKNLREWTTKVKQGADDAAPLEVLVKSLRTWLNLDKGVGVISGESPLSFRAARNGMLLLDKWLGGTQELALALPKGGDPEDPACPLEAGLPLGTAALSRSAVHAAGLLYVTRLEEAAQESKQEFDGSAHYKGSSFELFALALFDKKLVNHKPEDELSLLTYLAVHDLAQFTPLHPIFHHLRPSQRWNDLHPGHRFARAVEVVKEKELRLESLSAPSYFKFTSMICEELGWPEIPRFLDAVRESEVLDSDEPYPQMFRKACAKRESNPTAFFDPFGAVEHLQQLTPPGTQLTNVETSRDTDQALAFALEAELYAMGFQLFFGSEKPDLICPDYRETIELLNTPDEMLKAYFGLEF